MGSVELEAAVRRQGVESARAIVTSARERVASRRAELDAAWEQRRRSALLEAQAELAAQTEADLLLARRAALRLVLEGRHRAIERVLAAVRPRLLQASAARRDPARSQSELEDLLEYLPAQELRIRCPSWSVPRDPRAVIDEAIDGFLIETGDGSTIVDGTLSRRLEQLRPLLAIRILELIDAEAP